MSSRIGKLYAKAYNFLCGEHPHLRFWHFQWLAVKDLYADLKEILPTLEGKILDVGCGYKPYAVWLKSDIEHIGIDIYPGDSVDFVVEPNQRWPLATSDFDAVLCTQVLEHTINEVKTIEEISRVLNEGGLVILTVPFIYNQHAVPDDYRRFSIYGIRNLFEREFEGKFDIITVKAQGGVGSTIGLLLENWIEMQMNSYKVTRILKGFLLPVWMLICLFINTTGFILDSLDKTQSFYSNTLVVARKRCA